MLNLGRVSSASAAVAASGGRAAKRTSSTRLAGRAAAAAKELQNTTIAATSVSTTTSIRTMATLKIDNMNPAVKKMEYAVRGPLVIRANEIEKEIQQVNN